MQQEAEAVVQQVAGTPQAAAANMRLQQVRSSVLLPCTCDASYPPHVWACPDVALPWLDLVTGLGVTTLLQWL